MSLAQVMPPSPRPRRRPALLVAALALVAVGAAVTFVFLRMANGGEDPGVAACRISAQVAAEARTPTADEDRRVFEALAKSRDAGLRDVGTRWRRAGEAGDLTAVLAAAVDYAALCGKHGVVILTGTPGS